MKKFFVSKSDKSRIDFIKESIKKITPSNICVLCENDRSLLYSEITDSILPLKDLNKNSNWIKFINEFDSNSLLIIDNVLKFSFFGDGSKKYIKDFSQSINNIIVTDVVPFYTEPSEIFYPFWFLGKEILGYNSYSSFSSNHSEEKIDGNIEYAHSYDVLKHKIKDYYVQDYECFFAERTYIDWQLSESDIINYESRKSKESANFTNPIKMYNSCSEQINLIETKYKVLDNITKELNNCCIVINCLGIYPKMIKKHLQNKQVDFLSIHSNQEDFEKYDNVILSEMPIVKPHSWLYIEAGLKENQNIIQLRLTNNKLETYFTNKIFNNELRKQIDSCFYNANL